MIAALNRMHEWELHLKGALKNGVTKDEIQAVLHQVTIYCGVPVGVECFRIARKVFAEQERCLGSPNESERARAMSVEIARIAVYQADLPVPGGAYHLSGGRAFPALDSTLVKIETNKGVSTGWGESCPFGPVYLPAHALGVRAGIAELAPHLIGHDPTAVERLGELMDAALPGHYPRQVGPRSRLLGHRRQGWPSGRCARSWAGARRAPSTSSAASPARTPRPDGRDRRALPQPRATGPIPSRWAARWTRTWRASTPCRRQAAPGEVYQIDVNRGWTLDTALQVLSEVRGSNLYRGAALRHLPGVPGPEAPHRPAAHAGRDRLDPRGAVQQVLHDDGADALNLKIARVGGLTKARRLRDMAAAAGLALSIQDTGGAEVAFAAVVQLAPVDRREGVTAQPLGPARALHGGARRRRARGGGGAPSRPPTAPASA